MVGELVVTRDNGSKWDCKEICGVPQGINEEK